MSRCAGVFSGLAAIPLLVGSTVGGQEENPFGNSLPASKPEAGATADDPFGNRLPASKPEANAQIALTSALPEAKLPNEKSQSNEERIRAALQEKTSVEFMETPLSDVVEYLRDLHKIEIQFDLRAMEDAGADTDTPITARLSSISLRSAIRLILERHGLTFVVKDEVLLISTLDEAQNIFEIKLYDIRDLAGGGGSPVDAAKLNALVKVIQGTVFPATWNKSGGSGTIEPLTLDNEVCALVVSQTAEVHEQIEFVLGEIRKCKREHK